MVTVYSTKNCSNKKREKKKNSKKLRLCSHEVFKEDKKDKNARQSQRKKDKKQIQNEKSFQQGEDKELSIINFTELFSWS